MDVAGVYVDPHCRRRGSEEPSPRRLAALERLAKLRGEFGEVVFSLAVMLVIEDACWAVIGRKFRVDPKTARAWCVAAIGALRTI